MSSVISSVRIQCIREVFKDILKETILKSRIQKPYNKAKVSYLYQNPAMIKILMTPISIINLDYNKF